MASADIDATSRPFWQDPSAPDATNAASRVRTNQPAEELDDLFNYDVDMNDVSQGANAEAANIPTRTNGRTSVNNDDELGLGLGIDEEIKVRKPRAPIAKLDEERLLSAKGIPKLRRISKDRFKFKGKGHEFTDVSRLLNHYQLWLDDLFPKAKFADGLAIIEKLGHKKRLHVMRKEWIDEGKPKPTGEDRDADLDFVGDTNNTITETQNDQAQISDHELRPQNDLYRGVDDMDEDIYAEPTPPPPENPSRQEVSMPEKGTTGANEPGLDELDDLLAEDAARINNSNMTGLTLLQSSARDEFADDEEAMAEMENMW